MAFKQRTKAGYAVLQGNSGLVLHRFSGKNASKRADAKIVQLHRENKPKQSNRGKSAAKKHR